MHFREGARHGILPERSISDRSIANSDPTRLRAPMPIIFPDDLMVSVSGFRGRVGRPLTPELVAALAAGFGAFLQEEGEGDTVMVGRDSRTSGPMFARSVIAGLQSVGCQVVDLGLVPTPTLMLAVEEGSATGGIAVTASHNPAEWNALKFASGEGVFLDSERMARFQRSLTTGDPERAPWDRLGSLIEDESAVDRHLERILALPLLDLDGLRARRFQVALDCVNGAGGVIMRRLLEALGCEVVGIGLEPDGRFPRDPEPTAANLGDLAALVRESGAEIGLAVDPDVDRLSLVDETGTPIGEDYTLALSAAAVLEAEEGAVGKRRALDGGAPGADSGAPGAAAAPTVVINLSTSRVVEDAVSGFGARVVRAPVGEVNVARCMQREGAAIGGEGNGGVILPALHHTRDAPLGSALVLQRLLSSGRSLGEEVAAAPSYAIVKSKVAFERERLPRAYRALRKEMAADEVDDTDGLRLDWPERSSWVHVRPSGTEPVVRVIGEAPTRDGAEGLVREATEALAKAGA